jgi:DNA-binding MarR family transcriptional regulator
MSNHVMVCRRAMRIVENRVNSFFHSHGHEPRHIWVLFCTRNLNLSQGCCAERLGINKNVMVDLVDEMETKGLIHRIRNPENRKEIFLRVTKKGQNLLEWSDAVIESAILQGFHPLTKDQIDQLHAFAKSIVDANT